MYLQIFNALPRNVAWSLSLAVMLVLLAWLGDDWSKELQFERSSIHLGEYYRLVTGHFVHLGTLHAVLNGIALVIISWTFSESLTLPTWLATVIFCSLFISFGLLIVTEISWYRGFSGVLHGLFVAGSLTAGPILRWRIPLLLGLLVKLVFELYPGADSSTSALIGGEVVHIAHWLGAIGGGIMALWIVFPKRAKTEAPRKH